MMKISLMLTALFFSILMQAQNDVLQYKIDLNKVENDQLTIELTVPQMKEDKVSFHLPKMVPGTYSIYDFGRFVTDINVFDKDGNGLDFKRIDDNSWEILDAKKLAKIVYKVEDTWDTKKENVVFEPAGTNIDADKVFVFNNHGIFGFFKGMEYNPIRIEIDRPAKLYGGTAMKRIGGDADTDIFEARSYHYLVDSPIMFAEPDTAIIKVGNADVLIHTYSPTGKVKSKDLVADIFPVLDAQREYLGGKLPVDELRVLRHKRRGSFELRAGFTRKPGHPAFP
jgi:predicted metalloprotease with PDZ domain